MRGRTWGTYSPRSTARPRRTAALRYYRALAQPWYRSARYAPEQAHWMGIPDRPVLLLQGQDDGCLRPVFAERARDALAPGSAVELVPDAGHFLQLERPDQVNGLIERFIDER